MTNPARDLARRLAEKAEVVCAHYLSNGVREGRWWTVGDVHNTPGGSLLVRLDGPLHGPKRAGKWCDTASGQNGDLLDLIKLNQGYASTGEAMREAERFLGDPAAFERDRNAAHRRAPLKRRRSRDRAGASARLFHAAEPIKGTLAEDYLQGRAIAQTRHRALRYHPGVYYRARDGAPLERRPAMLAAVTNLAGEIVSVHRTWLDRETARIAPIRKPKRVMAEFLGSAVRFGCFGGAIVAGEGIETVLSVKSACPELYMEAGLSGSHLAGLVFPPTLRRLWVAQDLGRPGERVAAKLCARGRAEGFDVRVLKPLVDDFNTDLRRMGCAAFTARLRDLLADELTRLPRSAV